MLDYQRILDDVHVSLDSTSGETLDLLRSAAGDYRMACEEVNERLRRCDSFLRRGLRSEAIQLAEIEPVLLDIVTMLDFPDRPQWNNLLAQHGIAPGPSLSLDLAGELNEAYAHERPLAGLLAQHRLLALARSPLRTRIQVLRQLAEQDAQNAIWREDLSTYEHERQRQLHKEVTAASEAGNLAVLTSLDEELRGDPWLEPPSPGLLVSGAAEDAAPGCSGIRRDKSWNNSLPRWTRLIASSICPPDVSVRGWNAAAAVANQGRRRWARREKSRADPGLAGRAQDRLAGSGRSRAAASCRPARIGARTRRRSRSSRSDLSSCNARKGQEPPRLTWSNNTASDWRRSIAALFAAAAC